MTHDCRFCTCTTCSPWEEGVHNFRHTGRPETCSCDRCPQEPPLYFDTRLAREATAAIPAPT